MRLSILIGLAAKVMATNIFVADYNGSITTLKLSESRGTFNLQQSSVNQDCEPNPSWLTIDTHRRLLYCLNEGLSTPNGSLSSFLINSNGSLKHIQNTTTPSGPVSGTIYGNPAGQQAIVLAHYEGSAVSTWYIKDNGSFSKNQELFYTLDKPGPDSDRQDAPHEHEAITDPTGQYILVPDLGADVVHVFSWDADDLKLKELESLKYNGEVLHFIRANEIQAAPGSGPRHAAFYTPYGIAGGTTYLYLVAELAATVTGYAVSYLPNNGGLAFKEINEFSTIPFFNVPQRIAPAEIQITPDNRFLVISNRNDTSFKLSTANGSQVLSDSLSTFALSHDGAIKFHQLSPAGGSYPRHFRINAIGDLVAVGLQYSQEVVVLQRDIQSGLIGEPVARESLKGNVTCVMFDERPLSSFSGL